MTNERALAVAKQRSTGKGGSDSYVVISGEGEWDVTDDYGLETFYLGAYICAHYFGGDLVESDCI